MPSSRLLQVSAVIFDFDNTLVDTHSATKNAYVRIFDRIGKEFGIKNERLWEEITKIEAEQTGSVSKTKENYERSRYLKILAQRLSIPLSDREINDLAELFYTSVRDDIKFNPHTEKVLADLKAKGLKLALLTEKDSRYGYKSERISKMSFSKYFDTIIIAGETIPDGKVKPDAFVKTLEMLGIRPEEAVMVGDRLDIDIENSKKIGMFSILMEGYSDSRTSEFKPDFVIDDIDELRDIIA